jgi:hypothetical protein
VTAEDGAGARAAADEARCCWERRGRRRPLGCSDRARKNIPPTGLATDLWSLAAVLSVDELRFSGENALAVELTDGGARFTAAWWLLSAALCGLPAG